VRQDSSRIGVLLVRVDHALVVAHRPLVVQRARFGLRGLDISRIRARTSSLWPGLTANSKNHETCSLISAPARGSGVSTLVAAEAVIAKRALRV
jgi:hypothetical protein